MYCTQALNPKGCACAVTVRLAAKMRESTSQYLDFNHLFTNQQSISLPVLPLMPQHCGMTFSMKCVLPPQLGF